MTSLIATLPMPPSANRLYRALIKNRKQVLVKSAEYREWIKVALPVAVAATRIGDTFGEERFSFGRGVVKVTAVLIGPEGLGDIDNRLKAALDILQQACWIDNDKQVNEIRIVRGAFDRADPRMVISMRSM